MYRILAVVATVLLTATALRAEPIILQKPLACIPMQLAWMNFEQNEDEIKIYSAVHSGTEYPVMVYWNKNDNSITTIEFVEVTSKKKGSEKTKDVGQYACVAVVGDLIMKHTDKWGAKYK